MFLNNTVAFLIDNWTSLEWLAIVCLRLIVLVNETSWEPKSNDAFSVPSTMLTVKFFNLGPPKVGWNKPYKIHSHACLEFGLTFYWWCERFFSFIDIQRLHDGETCISSSMWHLSYFILCRWYLKNELGCLADFFQKHCQLEKKLKLWNHRTHLVQVQLHYRNLLNPPQLA